MQSKTFRLFISSTFSDFSEERKLLQTEVFPKIKTYCSENNLNFQAIDLRWGVSNEAQLDQKTLELCLEEVRASKINPHPNFLIMAGDRYGWVPLPYLIEKDEYETLLNLIDNEKEKTLLNTWYKLDLNQLPASYILNERKNEYVAYEAWEKVENSLRDILQTLVKKSNIKEKNKYFTSATEAEVIEGIFKYQNKTSHQEKLLENDEKLETKDYENVYAYIRNIKSCEQSYQNKFIDGDLNKVNSFKDEIKTSIDSSNILEVDVSLEEISQDEKNGSLEYSYETIKDKNDSIFVKTMIKFLQKSIDMHIETIKEYSNEDIEKFEQQRFKNDKLKDFLEGSRANAFKRIDEYINSEENQALVIHGKSGLGKSSLMAKAIENTLDKKPIYRFVGSTSNLSSTPQLLISILNELGINEEIRKVQNQQTLQEEPEKIEDFYYRVHDHLLSLEKDTIIFIDAIDQVSNEDEFLWLPETLKSNVKIIISALNDENYEEDSEYYEYLEDKTHYLYELEEFEENEAESLVLNLLKKYNRTIQPNQMQYLLNIYKDVKTPLYLSVAVQELRYWKSSESNQTLAATQKEIIEEFISNLSELFHHDKEFVKRIFSYLYLSEGLSESELLEIINTDKKLIKQLASDTYHTNLTGELPIVIWARLHTQIKEFLKLENKNNQETINFFHREFNDVISNQEDIRQVHEELISLLQKLIIKYQYDKFDSNRWGILYINIVVEYHKNYEFSYEIKEDSKLKIFATQLEDKIKNDSYKSQISIYLNNIGFSYSQSNNLKVSNIFYKFSFFFSEHIVKKEPSREGVLLYYIRSINNLSSSLSHHNNQLSAYNLLTLGIVLIKKLFELNKAEWLIDYLATLNNLSCLQKALGLNESSIENDKELIRVLEILYEQDKEKWIKFYTISLSNLSSSYRLNGNLEYSYELMKKVLEIREKKYNQNPDLYINDYINTIANFTSICIAMGDYEKLKAYPEKGYTKSKELYNKDSKKWINLYIRSSLSYALTLKNKQEFEKSLEINKETYEIISLEYEKEPEKYFSLYMESSINLSNIFLNKSMAKESLNILLHNFKILKSFNNKTSLSWFEYLKSNTNLIMLSFSQLKRIDESLKYIEESIAQVDKIEQEINKNDLMYLYETTLNNIFVNLYKSFELENHDFNKFNVLYEKLNFISLKLVNNIDLEKYGKQVLTVEMDYIQKCLPLNKILEIKKSYDNLISLTNRLFELSPERRHGFYLNQLDKAIDFNFNNMFFVDAYIYQDEYIKLLTKYSEVDEVDETLTVFYENLKIINENIKGYDDGFHLILNNLELFDYGFKEEIISIATEFSEMNQNQFALFIYYKLVKSYIYLYDLNPIKWLNGLIDSINKYIEFIFKHDLKKISDRLSLELLEQLQRYHEKDKLSWDINYKTFKSFLDLKVIQKDELFEYHLKSEDNLNDKINFIKNLNNLAYKYKSENKINESIDANCRLINLMRKIINSINDDNLITMYFMALNNVISDMSNENKKEYKKKIFEFKNLFFDTAKEFYNKNKDAFIEPYLISINTLAQSCILTDPNKTKKLYSLYIKTVDENEEIKQHEYLNSYYEYAIEYLKKITEPIKSKVYKEPLTSLLYISKALAFKNKQEQNINIINLYNSLKYVELSEEAFIEFSNIFNTQLNLNNIQKLTGGETLVKESKELPKINYSTEMKNIVKLLKNIFNDTKICNFYSPSSILNEILETEDKPSIIVKKIIKQLNIIENKEIIYDKLKPLMDKDNSILIQLLVVEADSLEKEGKIEESFDTRKKIVQTMRLNFHISHNSNNSYNYAKIWMTQTIKCIDYFIQKEDVDNLIEIISYYSKDRTVYLQIIDTLRLTNSNAQFIIDVNERLLNEIKAMFIKQPDKHVLYHYMIIVEVLNLHYSIIETLEKRMYVKKYNVLSEFENITSEFLSKNEDQKIIDFIERQKSVLPLSTEQITNVLNNQYEYNRKDFDNSLKEIYEILKKEKGE